METIQQAEQVRKDQQDAGKSDHLRSQGQVEQGQAILSQRHEGHDQAGPSDQTKAASEQERPWTKQDLHQFFVELAQTKNFNPKAIQDSLSEECKVIWMQLQTKNGPCLNDQEKGDMEQVFRAYGIPPTDKKCLYMRDKTEHRRKQKHKSDMKRNNIARSQGYKNATDMRYCKK
jgi:hypothetical protein